MKELNKKNLAVDGITESNLKALLERINKVRLLWGRPMIVSSGLRSQDQQLGLIKAGKTSAPKSKHLLGGAVDILDENGELKEWLKENPDILEMACLWCEHWDFTPNWVHFQIFPPPSGSRWFVP